ncbi:uncharacterized protein LOC139914508 [Centroberyx gerrardi]
MPPKETDTPIHQGSIKPIEEYSQTPQTPNATNHYLHSKQLLHSPNSPAIKESPMIKLPPQKPEGEGKVIDRQSGSVTDNVGHLGWSGVDTFDELCDLVILQQLKNSLPDSIATYVNERKVKTPSEAAVLADEFVLTHKNSFGELRNDDLVEGEVKIGVRPQLPVDGVDVILGNDLAGDRVWAEGPPHVVTQVPVKGSLFQEPVEGVPDFPERADPSLQELCDSALAADEMETAAQGYFFHDEVLEHFYDSQSGSGFLAWRLKTIQRKSKLVSKEPKTQTAGGGGPGQERELPQIGGQLDEERCKEVISLMNHISDREIILQKMETFEYRQHLIHNPDESHTVLTVFPRLLDTKGLILQDFSLLFGPETAAKLLEKWHTSYKGKVIREAESLTATPVLQSLLKSARNLYTDESSEDQWDSDMASFLLLLHILPPLPTKKKTQKISASQAMDRLVVFHKSCRSLEEHLQNQEGHHQLYLLASGTCKQAISTFYVVMDKKLIPCQGTTSLAAFDELFKVHFVFSVSHDDALRNMYTFQTTVYSIDTYKGEGIESQVHEQELRAKFLDNVYVQHL